MRSWSQRGPSRSGSQESSRTGSFSSFRRPSLSRLSGIFANTLSAGLAEAHENAKAEAKALKAEKAKADWERERNGGGAPGGKRRYGWREHLLHFGIGVFSSLVTLKVVDGKITVGKFVF